MSFSFTFVASEATLEDKLTATASNAPAPVKDYIRLAFKSWPADQLLAVVANGHLYDGKEGNYNVTSCTVEVRPSI